MIPVSLYIKNFLSYGENVPPLDFSEFSVACLSGDNGHGKSAILDAMTWVLWGEARKAVGEKSPSDGLLRIGSTEMQVEFVFDLEGDRYRVLRKYQRKKKRGGVPSLEFQVFDEATQAYKSLTESSIKQTQTKIDSTLRMNYDTFVNSAFILQGRVDEFTKRNPTQRKTVLADILDLSRYEDLRELARKHYHDAKNERDRLDQQLKAIREELDHKNEYEQKLEELSKILTEIDRKYSEYDIRRQTLETRRAELSGKQQQLHALQQQQQQCMKDKSQLEKRIARQEQQIAEVKTILGQETEILETYKRFIELSARNREYEEKLRRKLTCQTQKSALEQHIQKARHELEKELGKWQTERAQKQRILDEAQQFLKKEQEIDQGFRELHTCREQDEQWEEQRSKVEAIENELRKLEREIDQKKDQLNFKLQTLNQRIADLQKTADKQDSHAKKVRQAQATVAELDSLEKQLAEIKETAAQRKTQLEHLEAQRTRLQKQRQELEKKIELFTQEKSPQCPLCKTTLDAHKKAEIEQHFNAERQYLQQEETQTGQTIRELTTQQKNLQTEDKHLEAQVKKLAKSREQLMQAEHALQESRTAQEQVVGLNTQADDLQRRIHNKEYAQDEQKQLAELQQQKEALGYNKDAHQTLKQKIKTLRKFEGEYIKLEDTRRRQREASESLPATEQEITRLTSILERQEYAHEAQTELKQVLAQIAAIGYDEQAHEQVKRDVQPIQNAPIRKEQLEQAQKSIGTLQQTRDEMLGERQQKDKQIEEIQAHAKTLERDLNALPTVEQELKEINGQLQSLRRERDDLLQRQGMYQNKYDRCKQLEMEAVQLKAQKKEAERNQNLYEKLIHIFSKDGIQAYLIENAVPEIEEEANAILSRLTDNRTRIAIESVKDLKSGGTKETLDIKISDELGTRSYEMYSGGEAFRIDFAIRIALSKLLVTRAGTRLRTLVIDEGFGTQDARGIEQLVEAIKAISSDFEKILVVTHLESLKNAFPVRIEVVKLPDIGSQYQIVY